MDGAAGSLAAGPNEGQDKGQDKGPDLRLELERKRLNLRVLLETAQELSGILQPRKIVETFLLTAMGPIGAMRGVAVLARPAACEGLVLTRGLPGAEAEALEQRLPDICDAYFPYRDLDGDVLVSKIRALRPDQAAGDGLLPRGMDILLCFSVDEDHCGLLALGPLLGGAAVLDADAADLLHGLLHILIGALRGALAVSSIRQLSVDLGRKNDRLSEALAASQAAQRSLDRRVHQLAAINELAGELAHRHQVREILDSFLLTMLGAFSVSSGLVLVLDRAAHGVDLAVRGAPGAVGEVAGLSGFGAADVLVYKAFTATGARSVAPLTVEPVAAPGAALAGCGLPFEAACAVYFALDKGVQGVLVLGQTLSGEALEDEDAQLVRAQTATLLGYVQGARRYSTITVLNDGLVQQNEELTRTVTELTEARQTIALLERAGESVRAFLRSEALRSRRFSWLDCGVILLASLLLGFLFNLASPNGVPLAPEHLRRPPAQTVTAQKARELQQSEGALMVDARPQAFYEQRRVRGAANLTPALFDMVYLMRFAQLPLSTPIIVYGGNISRRWDEDVAARLTAREHERVLVLEDGLPAWVARGYPVEP
ncbi:MAG: rhodanese-like domain-containing protein [Humidesulfovibrio sp.]|nr:rhodanese-like domain-containing protein [Humidesulfovibrio sp.]